jgi:hypothetical protein
MPVGKATRFRVEIEGVSDQIGAINAENDGRTARFVFATAILATTTLVFVEIRADRYRRA